MGWLSHCGRAVDDNDGDGVLAALWLWENRSGVCGWMTDGTMDGMGMGRNSTSWLTWVQGHLPVPLALQMTNVRAQ